MSQDWLARDFKSIWHPYTQMKDLETYPLILIEKALGLRLFDSEGRFYFDTVSSWWCNVHGHNHPAIQAAIQSQIQVLDHVLFAGFTHKPAIILAEKILNLLPHHFKKVFFSDNGSTSIEVALKMSFQYWQQVGQKKKTQFVSFDLAYHGDTIGAMSVGGRNIFNEIFSPLFFSSIKIPTPYCYRCPFGKKRASCQLQCADAMETIIKEHHEHIAGIILEPLLLAVGGMIVYPHDYLERVGRVARKYQIHLICDEVATGFGRTGKMFAVDHVTLKPDFVCLSKGLTSGTLPLGLTVTTDEIYRAFYDDFFKKKTFYHGHTFTANPIACSAAIASLTVFEEEQTLARIAPFIPYFQKSLEKFRRLSIVGDVRTIGLVAGIELVQNKNTQESFPVEERLGFRIYQEGLKRSLILRPLGDIVYLFLPLCITKEELDYILETCFEIIEEFGD